MLISERIEDKVNGIVSKNLNLPLSVVEKLNIFQWRIVLESTNKFKDIEITDLGKLKVKQKVVLNKIDKINLNKSITEKKLSFTDDPKARNRFSKKIESLDSNIEFLKKKLK